MGYKKIEVEVLDKESKYLKLYKIIPLELYIVAGICTLVALISIIKTYYLGYYDVLETLIYSFICIINNMRCIETYKSVIHT